MRDFYKSNYAFEIARKTDLTSALALPVGVVSLLVGAVVAMSKDLHLPLGLVEQILLACIGISAAACALAGYFLYRASYNFEYGYAPTPQEIKEYIGRLIKFHQTQGHGLVEAERISETETLDYIDVMCAKYSTINAANNDIKSAFLHKANGAIMKAVLYSALAGGTYVFNSIFSAPTIHKIEVVKPKEVSIMTTIPHVPPATTPSPATIPAPAVRPLPPPGRLIKEDRNPPKPQLSSFPR